MNIILIKNSKDRYFPEWIEDIIKDEESEIRGREVICDYIKEDAKKNAITKDMLNPEIIQKHEGHFVKVLGMLNWYFTWNSDNDSIVSYEKIEIEKDPDYNMSIEKANDINEKIHYEKRN